MCFQSRVAFTSERIHAAAVYCSDGRFGEAFDDFLTNGLSLPRVDRLAMPGGPACLAGYRQARLREDGVLGELKFLVEAHELDKVVLIQHQGCAFYGAFLEVPDERLAALQRADLVRAAHFVKQQTPDSTKVEGYFAAVEDGKVRFEPVPVI